MAGVQAAFADRDVAFLRARRGAGAVRGLPGAQEVRRAGGSELEDLYTLAACDLIVGPRSTYSGWASLYGDVPRYVIEDPDAIPAAEAFEVHYGLGWGRRGLRDWTPHPDATPLLR